MNNSKNWSGQNLTSLTACDGPAPVVTGTPPPAISYFSLHNLPVPNTGIMFGGVVANGTRRYRTNDTYTVSMMNDQVVSY